jgi:hypothetical protein
MESREFWLQKNWVLQGMWAVCTLGRTILWNHTGYVWPITLSSHMISTRRWKFMLVTTIFSFSNFVVMLTVIWFNLEPLDDYSFSDFFFFSGHTRHIRWSLRSSIRLTMSSSSTGLHLTNSICSRMSWQDVWFCVDIVSFLLLCMPWFF